MHVISRKALKTFWEMHADAERPLQLWFRLAKTATWPSWENVKNLFGKRVDRYRAFTIFDIGGNKYRLVTVINYQNQKVFIRHVMTHAVYSRGDWKKDKFTVKRFGKTKK